MLHLFFPDIVNSAIIVGNEDSEENSAIIVGNEDSEESKLCSPKHNFVLYNNSAIIVGNEDSEESKLCSSKHNFLLYNQYRKKSKQGVPGNCLQLPGTLDGPHGLATTLAGPWGGGVWCGRDLSRKDLSWSCIRQLYQAAIENWVRLQARTCNSVSSTFSVNSGHV
ncbi:hypothetical protein BY996DRAFT_8483314 [Phakopsora pachyrhizi]|nr:hypothetical protein BY996DRAFT_8483314 [Phakopsora pachyrhizi]